MTAVVDFSKMQVGRKGGGKHWTKDEVARRQAAAQKVKPKKSVKLKMPEWLDEAAQAVWKKTMKSMKGMEILDKVDEDVLAVYCDAVARHNEAVTKKHEFDIDWIKVAQSYARLILQYADKLGLNPNSRARLAKKIAEDKDDPNKDLFD